MASSVDPDYWTTRPTFGVAGGPLEHALTPAGRSRAFSVGAQVRLEHVPALELLRERGGRAWLVVRKGAKLSPTVCGKVPSIHWTYLQDLGYITRPDIDSIELTPAGRAACERGDLERASLLERVRAAHPLT